MGVTDKPLEMDDLPKVPEHLKSDKEHDRFCDVWNAAEACWTFIAPIKDKKGKAKSKEKGGNYSKHSNQNKKQQYI